MTSSKQTNFNVVLDVGINNLDLNQSITLTKAANNGMKIIGCYPISCFKSLDNLDKDTQITIDLKFGYTQEKHLCLTGKISVQLILVCQRCLGELKQDIKTNTQLAFMSKDFQGVLTSGFERFDLIEKYLSIQNIISDEILLALPFSPKHSNCKQNYLNTQQKDTYKPFRNLKSIQ